MAVQVSPRDLDQVLVAYEGGVVLWSISKQVAVYSYSLMLPPGAPGGGSYQDDDLFTERNPGVTCITWHPSALCFAVGCALSSAISDDCLMPADSDPIDQTRTAASPSGPSRIQISL